MRRTNAVFHANYDTLWTRLTPNFSSFAGVFILNLVCRNMVLRDEVLSDVRSVFPQLCSLKIEDEVNEIIFALPQEKGTDWDNPHVRDAFLVSVKMSVAKLQQRAQQSNEQSTWDSNLDLCGLMNGLGILWQDYLL